MFEFTVYSKLIVGSPKVNDQSSDDLNGHQILLYWPLGGFFLFLKSKSFSYEV